MDQTGGSGNQIVDELCSFAGRGAGTDAERRAANAMASRLRGIGRRAEVEPTYVHPQWALVHALHSVVAIAGSIVAVSQPGIGFALVLAAATSAYLDLNTRFYALRRIFFRRASQNVVSPGGTPEAPLRLVLVAHLDAGRPGSATGPRAVRIARRLSPRMRVALSPWRVYFWGGIAALLPVVGLRMAGVEAQWVSVVQMVPTVIAIASIFVLVDMALSDPVPGAVDNASGVAAVLDAAERLRAEPVEGLDVWVVLAGAGECQAEGMRSFLRAHKGNLEPERTAIVNVDSVGFGSPRYTVTEGAAIGTPTDQGLISICEALAASEVGAAGPRPIASPLPSDALAAQIRRIPAITVAGLDENGLPSPAHHTEEAVPARCDAAAIGRAADLLVSMARLLEREAARRVSA
ncbi:hypothetical protein BH20ACT15_BH20ACT15_02490 [soil metagenome]